MKITKEEKNKFCSRFCTNKMGWSNAKRDECRRETSCNMYDYWERTKDLESVMYDLSMIPTEDLVIELRKRGEI